MKKLTLWIASGVAWIACAVLVGALESERTIHWGSKHTYEHRYVIDSWRGKFRFGRVYNLPESALPELATDQGITQIRSRTRTAWTIGPVGFWSGDERGYAGAHHVQRIDLASWLIGLVLVWPVLLYTVDFIGFLRRRKRSARVHASPDRKTGAAEE